MNRVSTREALEAAGWVTRPLLGGDEAGLLARKVWLGAHGSGEVLAQEAVLRWRDYDAAPSDYVLGEDLVARRVADGAAFRLS